METTTPSPENQRYNDESNFLDGLYEFHPELFKSLSEQEMKVLQTYYLVGQEVPEDVFAFRRKLTREQPEIKGEAHQAFSQLLKLAGIEEFHYSQDYIPKAG